MLAWIALGLAVLLGLTIILGGGSFGGLEGGEVAYLIAGSALAGLYVLGLFSGYQGRAWQGLRHALIWAGLFLAVVTGYAYRDVLTGAAARVTGELSPPGTALDAETNAAGEHSVRLRRRSGGQFAARAQVNGTLVTMLVDTGASTVVLKPADAEKAGVDLSGLAYTVAVDTANGTSYAAPVRVRTLAIGPIEMRDVEALVTKPGSLKESLLGMSFLKRLRSYEFSGEYLTLRS